MRNLSYLVVLFLFLISTVSCKKNTLQVTTTAISSLGVTSAYSGGDVIDDGGSEVFLRGVCYGENSGPSLSNSPYTQDGSGTG